MLGRLSGALEKINLDPQLTFGPPVAAKEMTPGERSGWKRAKGVGSLPGADKSNAAVH